jgi:16S rRNA (guanine966-N2)-methyltransferase
MRVVAGSARGRKLVAPEGLAVRPTAERVRQATFNALHHRGVIENAHVVDLFAGTGALGIEALSRGAAHATFVEHDRAALDAINQNLDHLGFRSRATVVRGDALRWLATAKGFFDLVLIDPPYSFEDWTTVLSLAESLVRPPADETDREVGIVVIETTRPIAPSLSWEVVREQRYGGTVITFAVPALEFANPDSP